MTRMWLRRNALQFTLLAGCAGCGAEADPFETTEQPIVYGTISGRNEDAVVAVRSPGAKCTGTLIAPNLVLTAHHCIAEFVRGDHTCRADGSIQNSNTGAGAILDLLDPATIQIFAQNDLTTPVAVAATLIETDKNDVCSDDIGFVILDRSLPNLPIAPVRVDPHLRLDQSLVLVGYGETEFNIVLGRNRREVPIMGVEPLPRTFLMAQGACRGDSGGPALMPETGAVTGVTSTATQDCLDPEATSVYTHVAKFKDLLLSAYAAAGAEPWFEGDPRPGTGSAGEGGSSGATAEAGTAGSGARTHHGDEGSGCSLASDASRFSRSGRAIWSGIAAFALALVAARRRAR